MLESLPVAPGARMRGRTSCCPPAFLKFLLTAAILSLAIAVPAQPAGPVGSDTNELEKSVSELKGMALEDLLNVQVTSVSRRAERLVDTPSAIQVITGEEIRRSGASSLPEALRLASNLEVSQVDSRQWAISARGFNSTTADKLQVLIDGRSVYTPLFSGVFWDVQNVMLEDVDRVEVISGPGASLWGANAVNGVINVVTKSARDTQGWLVSGGGGSLLNGFGSVRYGDKVGEDLYFRVYGMGFDRDSTVLPSGSDATNGWRLGQGGFRADWLPKSGDTLTLQGDGYAGSFDQVAPGQTRVNGQNVISRWTHPLGDESDFTLQGYWDRTWRSIPETFSENLNTLDVDFLHRFGIGERQRFLWGAGYRLMADHVDNGEVLQFLPGRRKLQLFSGFAQDEITLVEDSLFLTAGTKLEHNDYSGFEVQPTGRLAWKPATNHTIWAAISRAVRSPSRIDADFNVPGPPVTIIPSGDRFDSEKLNAYELGYRAQITDRAGVSLSTFFNDYDKVRSVEPVAGTTDEFIILNKLSAQTYGVELAADYTPLDWWRLRGGYTFFHKEIFLNDSQDINLGRGEGNDPHHWFVVHSMMDLPGRFELDTVVRYQDALDQAGPSVPSFVAVDVRLGWNATKNLELSIIGQNLLDNQHPEFGDRATRQEIPRGVYGKVTWKF